MTKNQVRTRFAPSPTGSMHIGNLRSALFEYLIAKSQGGSFILRMEDTDQARLVQGAERTIYRTLKQAGLQHDEGPDKGGPYGPYKQSERLPLYRQHAEQLLADGHAYRCFCSRERLESLATSDNPFGYDGHCRRLSEEEVQSRLENKEPYVIRQRMPESGVTSFQDEVYGTIEVKNEELEDQILLKSDGFPTYNFANVVDDHLMNISHVVRGSEYLSSTPKYNLLYEAFGWSLPTYVHLPLILGEDGAKLSKRHGATSFEELLNAGYLADAIINYIAFLGWSPGDEREVFSLAELEGAFSPRRISKSPAVFSYDKLRWFNEIYIRALDPKAFANRIRFLTDKAMGRTDYDRDLLAGLLQGRIATFAEIPEKIAFFSQPEALSEELFTNKKAKLTPELVLTIIKAVRPALAASDFSYAAIERILKEQVETSGLKTGQVMGALRLAAATVPVTPGGAIEILTLLGREEGLARLDAALAFLRGSQPEEASPDTVETSGRNFIEQIVEEYLSQPGAGPIHTRFPPEPNGFLHIGHSKALVINFGIAKRYGGITNLRMDDTNPVKEDEAYVNAIKEDIRWLGYDWGDRFYHASDFFPEMYNFALELIEKGLAYVDQQSAEEISRSRGTLTTPGVNSPYRDRPSGESLDLFRRMRQGEFPDGSMVLRAKIDMKSGNMNLRDPVLYRILHREHHRTGNDWPIYPMYDFAHPLEDALEGITHSLCSIEFEDHRPLYEWVIDNTSVPAQPRQIEFARLGINYTVMSKRKLRELVDQGLVESWDDPRMPTLRGMRRRGFTPRAIRNFIERLGVSKVPSVAEDRFLEYCVREDLNERALRAMAVQDPLLLILDEAPGSGGVVDITNLPGQPEKGTHQASWSRRLYIEREDFQEEPDPNFYRLAPGRSVRLLELGPIRCTHIEKDPAGQITAVHAKRQAEGQERIRATLHWVDAETAIDADLYLYDRLFAVEYPDQEDLPYDQLLNPDSVRIMKGAKLERWLLEAESDVGFQFLRLGYFVRDPQMGPDGHLRFNRSVPLRDSYRPAEA